MSSDKFALPKPIRYDEAVGMDLAKQDINTTQYVVAGAKLCCTKSRQCLSLQSAKAIVDNAYTDTYSGLEPKAQFEKTLDVVKEATTQNMGAKSPVTLSTLFRGATTGFSIVALDCDRKPENFIGNFGECIKEGKDCPNKEI